MVGLFLDSLAIAKDLLLSEDFIHLAEPYSLFPETCGVEILGVISITLFL